MFCRPYFSQPAGTHPFKFGQYLEDLRAYFLVLGTDMDVLLAEVRSSPGAVISSGSSGLSALRGALGGGACSALPLSVWLSAASPATSGAIESLEFNIPPPSLVSAASVTDSPRLRM